MTKMNDTLETIAASQASETVPDGMSTQDKVATAIDAVDLVGTAALTETAAGVVSVAGAVAEGIGGAVEVVGSILGGLFHLSS